MSEPAPLKRSPLREAHATLGARLVSFAGWEMPLQYSGIVEEHRAVRGRVGVFDISHMGRFLVEGRGAEAFLNRMVTGNLGRIEPGRGLYTFLLNEHGGVIDDLIVYRLSEREFLLVVNASMTEADFAWLGRHAGDADVRLTDISAATGGLAVQGPKSREVLRAVLGDAAVFPERNTILISTTGDGVLYLCGTGYTGEEGFEFFAPVATIAAWFEKFVNAAREAGGLPAGLGARDTLRLEMGYPLNGSDLSPERTPFEAGLGLFVDMEKGDFIGREALARQRDGGVKVKLTGFQMTSAGPPPRAHYPVWAGGTVVGEVCSGGLSPSLARGIGMAYLPVALSSPGNAIEIEVRGRRLGAETVKRPFHRRTGSKV